MNKTKNFYYFLRIIFLTFAIVSLVFAFCKKVGFCSGAGNNGFDTSNNNLVGGYPVDLPYPYGDGAFQVYGKDSGVDLSAVVNSLLSWNSDITLITVGYADELNSDVRCFHGWYQGYYSGNLSSAYLSPDFPQLNINGGRFDVYFDTSTGTILNGPPSGTYTECSSLRLGDYSLPVVLASGQTEYYHLQKDIWIPGYPIYYYGNQNIYVGNTFCFLYDNDTVGSIDSAIGLTGDITGSVSGENLVNPITDSNGNVIVDSNGNPIGYTGSYSSDLDLEISIDTSGLDEKLDSIQGNQEDIKDSIDSMGGTLGSIAGKVDTVNGKLDSINGKLSGWDKMKAFYNNIHDLGLDSNGNFSLIELLKNLFIPPSGSLEQEMNSGTMHSDIQNLKGQVNRVKDFVSNTPAAESYYWEFKFATDIVNSYSPLAETGDFRVYFDWWQYIRDKFWKYFRYFFIFGNILLFLRKIPSAINGISSTGDSTV